ncbi:MAG TPA: ABC transporter permease [Thermoanaerobaculia bacterium]|nr:ABC transporter permease [Thermoanaerobaculia bacterium]
MKTLWQDLKFGLRQLATERGFSFAAILTLTLGIGATATIFTVVNSVLMSELPYRDPEQLVVLQGSFVDKGETVTPWPLSQADIKDWRERSSAFSDVAVWGSLAFNLEQGQDSLRLSGELVNWQYFRLLGLTPAAGRFFTEDEDANPMERFVVVLGHGFWRNHFNGDPKTVGSKLQINGRSYEVVGVAPEGFRGLSDQADVWVPSMLPPIPLYVTERGIRWAAGAARLKPGVTAEQAQQQMNGVTAALASELPDSNTGLGAAVVPLEEFWFGKLRKGLVLLSVGAVILLVIACINVASLLLTKAVVKQRAWAIRVALGASRGRMIRQLLTESLLLSVIGAVTGLILAQWAARALIAVSGAQFPSFIEIGAKPGVIAATLGLAVLCGLLFGLVPVLISFRTRLTESLGRDDKSEQPAGRGWYGFQNAVVVAQVALALTLSIGAVLMAKGFYQMIGEDLGFRREGLLTFRMEPRGPKYLDDQVIVNMVRQDYLPRISAVPGVGQVAIAASTIPTDDWAGSFVTIEDHDSDRPDGTYPAMIRTVTPAYFDVLGVPLQRGRAFNSQDTESNAVIISKAMADLHWPGQDAIGKRLKIGPRGREVPWMSVVGVSADVQYEGLQGEAAPAPDMYTSMLQFVRRPLTVNFLVRPKPGVSVDQLRNALNQEMKAINPEIPAFDMATMEERLAKQTNTARFQVILIGVFTVLALALAAVGIYGVISYSITQRSREIAIRMSLGADRGRILLMVLARGAVLAGIGLALGLLGVFFLDRFLADLMSQASVVDPLVLGGTSLVLFVVTLVANLLPARRASVLDPMNVLRFG